MDNKIPYALRSRIVEWSRDSKKPRTHTALSEREIRIRNQQSIPEITGRLDHQQQHKSRLVAEVKRQRLSARDLVFHRKAGEDIRRFQQWQQTLDPLAPPVLRREPNYYKYLPRDFVDYLLTHPHSKKTHIAFWRDHVLVFVSHHGIKVVDYQLPMGWVGNEEQAVMAVRGENVDYHVVPLF